ncbi:hypothetical protein ACIQH9_20090 [Pseudarthrobacter oxydans]|uniref:hypothetical protein n=1 Tax=Pseudarthrobacter oxydans TaxID=1671 RepID=UPI00380A669F
MDETTPIETTGDWEWKHPHTDELDELRAQINAHEGTRRARLLSDLARTFDAWARFSRTFHSLLLACETDEDTILELMRNVGDRTKQDSLVTALDQAIIAYGAGAGAVVDQSRNVLKLQSAELREAEAAHRNSVIGPIPGAVFLTKLRNYVLHYVAAPWEFTGEIQDDRQTAKVLLASDALKRFDWNVATREFIESQGDGVQLSNLLQPFLIAMTDHTNWILEQCYNENAQLTADVNGLVAKSNLLLTGGASDGRDWEARMAHVAENLKRKERGESQLDYQTGKPISEAT